MTSKRIIYYLLAAFITGNLLLIFMQYNSARNIDDLISGNEKLLNEFKTGNELKELEKNIISIQSDVRGAVAMGDAGIAAGIDQQQKEVQRDLYLLQQINDDDSSVKYIDDLDRLVKEKILFSRQVLDTFVHAGKQAAELLMSDQQGRELMDSISLVAHRIDTSRQVLLTRVIQSIDDSGRKARRWGIILIGIVLISGAVLFWYIINRIASQNQLIRQLDASEKKEREAAKVKENFLANMSHEIRTPMNAILGFTALLEKKKLDDESADYVHTIRQSGENLLTIINDILDLSRIEAGMMRIESSPFSVRELMHSVETMFQEKAKEKGLMLSTAVDDNVPATLEGDAVRLTQILVNLIGNALKFTRYGSITVSVQAEEEVLNKTNLRVSVSDTGIGIDKDKLDSIFDRFRQAEDSITRKYGGTGLGLSIVKDLITLQNGSISVISEPGLGTRFQFSIPYKVQSATNVKQQLPDHKRDDAVSFERMRVLVVEDNEINQLLMKKILSTWKMTPVVASNGKIAIGLLREQQFDLILMDIQMPEIDGYTAADMIRRELRIKTPIIAMTAHALAGEREKCLSLGMDDYIAKPVREQELITVVSRILQVGQKGNEFPKNTSHRQYKYIDLTYMKEISGGDVAYEETVTSQFLEIVPADLEKMNAALLNNDFQELSRLAHSLKGSIAVMGLNAALEQDLDIIEQGNAPDKIETSLLKIAAYCRDAIIEATDFKKTIVNVSLE